VRSADSLAVLRRCLGELELALAEDLLSPNFITTPLLVKGAWLPVGKEVASALLGPSGEVQQLAEDGPQDLTDPEGLAGQKEVRACWG
jgi:hypothetical protein